MTSTEHTDEKAQVPVALIERCLRLRNDDGTHKVPAEARNIIRAAMDAHPCDRHGPAMPFTLLVPTNRADNPDGEHLNVGTNHVDVVVVLEPDMTLRGECRPDYGGAVIALREWNEQVFLHELLHVATGYAQPPIMTTYPPYGHEIISRVEVALWETGWRMTLPPGERS